MGGMSMVPGNSVNPMDLSKLPKPPQTPNLGSIAGTMGQQDPMQMLQQLMQTQQTTQAPPPMVPLPTSASTPPSPMTPFAANPYAGFVNPYSTQRLNGMSPEDWVYQNMMAGMGSPVPGAAAPNNVTNQLVPGSSQAAAYTPNPYQGTLESIITGIPTDTGGGTTPPPAGLVGDLNGDGKLGKKERKLLKKGGTPVIPPVPGADPEETLAGMSSPAANDLAAQYYNPYYYFTG